MHFEERHDLYISPDIIRMLKPRGIAWFGHAHVCRKGSVCTGVWWGNLRERHHLEDPSVDMIIVLKWILKENNAGGWGVD
jgi:hypothetical protein